MFRALDVYRVGFYGTLPVIFPIVAVMPFHPSRSKMIISNSGRYGNRYIIVEVRPQFQMANTSAYWLFEERIHRIDFSQQITYGVLAMRNRCKDDIEGFPTAPEIIAALHELFSYLNSLPSVIFAVIFLPQFSMRVENFFA